MKKVILFMSSFRFRLKIARAPFFRRAWQFHYSVVGTKTKYSVLIMVIILLLSVGIRGFIIHQKKTNIKNDTFSYLKHEGYSKKDLENTKVVKV